MKFNLMMRNLLFVIILLIPTALSASYKGRVFVDENRNGVYDLGEKLLDGVMVTDGLHVVLTDAKGGFELPGHNKARFITVTTPSGYKPLTNHYLKIENSVDSYDFSLEQWSERIAEDGSHKFIQLADTEIFNTANHERWTHTIRDFTKNEEVAFIVHSGDICYEEGLKNHIKIMNSDNMAAPMYYGIGNHDLVKGDYGEQLFEELYGPTWYSFDYGNVHYIMTPMPAGDYKPSYTEADVYSWLKNDLACIKEGTPIICFNHDLKSYSEEFIFKKNNKEQLVLSDFNLKAWFYGHWHNNFIIQQGKVKTVSTATLDKGGIDHSTSGFRLALVDGKGDVETQLRYTYNKNQLHIASISDDISLANNSSGEIPLVVNAYHSNSPVKKVSYSIYEGDKLVEANQTLNQATDWSWVATLRLADKYINKRIFVEVKSETNSGEIAKCCDSFIYKANHTKKVELGQDWRTLLGNSEHNKVSTGSLGFPIQLSWSTNVSANLFMSSPIVSDGMVYIASVDEDLKGEGGIFALDAVSGDVIWTFRTVNSVKNTIAVEGDNVFAQDAEGNLYAVNKKTGTLAWQKKLDVDKLPLLAAGLTSRNGVVYAGSGKGLAAFNAESGDLVWNNKEWRQNQGTTSTLSANEEVLISGAQWSAMYANDINTGKLLWSQSKNGISNRGASPAIHNGLAYFISHRSLFVLEAKSGSIILSKELPYNLDVTSTPLVTESLIVFGSADRGLIALNREDLSEEWTVNTLPALIYSAPYVSYPASTVETSAIAIGNHALFGASDGIIYAINLKDGSVDWKHELGSPIFSSIALSGNTFFVSDFGGNVYAFTF